MSFKIRAIFASRIFHIPLSRIGRQTMPIVSQRRFIVHFVFERARDHRFPSWKFFKSNEKIVRGYEGVANQFHFRFFLLPFPK